MRLTLIALLTAVPALAFGQQSALTSADSALVGRILLAEDRRDSTDPALAEGAHHSDARVRTLVLRARGRISDSLFRARDSLPALPTPPVWPEPAWRLRYRALAALRADSAQAATRNPCPAFRAALADSAWPVRLRALDLIPARCVTDDSLVSAVREWVASHRGETTRREPGGVSWQAAAHAIVALARLRPTEAKLKLSGLLNHPRWQLRLYAVRAAVVIADTFRLQKLGRDSNDNVKEAAIEALSKLTGHADDSLFLMALAAEGAPAVRAAAIALKGSPRRDVRAAANAAFERWVAKGIASARDVRLALLDAAGRPAGDDRPPPPRHELPADAVALALGKDVRLRVTMSPASGGGTFVVRLRGDNAPIMAARILDLARSGYYDHTSWHRVEADFVIQGGGPGANEYVGNAQYLRDELGTVPHLRGTVGMSTRGHDTGDAQWFVNLKDNLRLNRDYTIFGEVTEGIEAVDGILEGDMIESIREVRGGPGR